MKKTTASQTKSPDNSVGQQKAPLLFAHRGGNAAGFEKENTLAAFAAAVDLGYDHLETDVVCTKDDRVVVFHGSQNRYMRWKTGLETRKYYQSQTYAELFRRTGSNTARPLLLEDLLRKFPSATFSIDAKTWEVCRPLAEAIQATKSHHRVCVTSFNLRRTLRVVDLLGGSSQVKASLCLYRVGAYLLKWFPRLSLKYIASRGIRVIQVPYVCVDSKLLAAARRNGIEVYAWSVNSSEEMRRLSGLGVDGIISDDVKLLRETITELYIKQRKWLTNRVKVK